MMAKSSHQLTLRFLVFLSFLIRYSNQLQSSQAQTLLRIQLLLDSPPVLENWNEKTDFCNTEQTPSLTLICYDESITQLHIIGNEPTPILPRNFSLDSFVTTLVRLPSLKVLTLVSLGLWGPLPGKISRLSSLEILNVKRKVTLGSHFHIKRDDDCNYTRTHSWKDGDEDCCAWDGVECDNTTGHIIELDLPYSCFYGTIPANSSLFTLIHIEALLLGGNHFNNSQISPKFGNLRNLTLLDLDDSEFSGDVPNEILQLQKLKYLDLSGNNRLTGNLSNLNTIEIEDLHLSGTCFFGDIPNSIGQFKSLRILLLSDCCLHGTIPQSIMNLQNLVVLDLSNNKLYGTIPASLGNLTQLSTLNFGNNSLSGKIPSSYSKLPNIGDLDLSHNFLSGPPLTCMFLNQSLVYLDLSDNQFTGEIHDCFNESTTNLEVLYLRQNNFHGTIPQSIGFANNLKILDLNSNGLQGVLPRSLKNCTSLEVLNLGGNMLMDGFPFWLGDLTLLKVLVLRDNKFGGTMKGMLPTFFTNLHIIDMSHNDLTGNLPSEYFEKWNAMAIVDEKATGLGYMETIPGIYYSVTIVNKGLSLPYEKIQVNFKVIEFSRNRFYGNIPLSLGRLKGVHVLNLSGNSLTGTIPISLGDLTSLESLDLSNNNLSGKMPSEIRNLKFLEFLNVSQNNLSGVIPNGEQLNTFSSASYEANPNLCGIPLPKCTIPSSPKVAEKKNHYKFEIDGFGWEIVLIGYTCGMMLGVAIGCCILRNKEEWIMGIFRLKIRQSPKRSNKK